MKCVFDNLDEYILVISSDGYIKYCNRCLLSKLEYSNDDIYMKNIDDILENRSKDIEKILNSKSELNIDLNLHSKSKEIISITSKVVLEKWNGENAIFIISKDISDKFYTKKNLENLLDSQPIASWLKDINGRYLYVNSSLDPSKNSKYMIGKYDYDVLGKEAALYYQKIDKEIIESKIPKIIERNIDNKLFEVYRTPILENGEVKYIAGTAREITLEKTMEHEISKNNKYISNLYNILNKKNKENDLYKMLENISGNIKDYLEVDGLSIFLYDKDNEVLESKVRLGMAKKNFEINKSISLPKKYINELIINGDHEGLNHVDENDFIIDKNIVKDNGIEYFGIYNITVNDEFIGLMTFGYGSKNKQICKMNDKINSICSEIAIIINSFRLSKEVNDEFTRRIETEKELEAFLDTAVDLMGIVDEKGCFKKVSNQWTNTLGWSREELLSMTYNDLVYKDDLNCNIKAVVRDKYKNDKVHIKHRMVCKNNEYRWLELNFKYLREKKEYIITARDITEEKMLEEERQALQEAIHLESIKNEFFANISHEFKTPLNIILGTIQLIERYANNKKINDSNITCLNRYVSPIKQNSYRLLRLVNNLIDMTRIDSGYYDLNRENNNIVSIVEDITMSVTQYVEDKGISLIFDTNEEELILACDVDKIERIMLNLISNAIKYTDDNGEIKVNVDCQKDKVRVSVKDNGIGISKEKIDLIFERFIQVDNSLTRRCEGSGIGLSLVKSLVEMHNGKIEVHSKVGKGSEFIFEIPVSKVENKSRYKFIRDKLDFQIEKCNIEFSDIYSL